MNGNWIWIVICAAAMILLIGLLWLADYYSKGQKKVRQPKPIKEAAVPQPRIFSPAPPPAPENPEKLQNTTLADELLSLTEKSDATAAAEAAQGERIRGNRLRVRNYYETKWGNRQMEFDSYYDTHPNAAHDTDELSITQDDVKRLMVIKDLFDKK